MTNTPALIQVPQVFELPGVTVTPVTVDFDPGTPLEVVDEVLARCLVLEDFCPWGIGESVLYAHDELGQSWVDICTRHRMNYRRAARYVAVAKAVPRENRRADVSFAHHDAVSTLSPEEQAEFLALAARADMDAGQLAAHVKAKDTEAIAAHQATLPPERPPRPAPEPAPAADVAPEPTPVTVLPTRPIVLRLTAECGHADAGLVMARLREVLEDLDAWADERELANVVFSIEAPAAA